MFSVTAFGFDPWRFRFWPVFVCGVTQRGGQDYTVGALADSYYEYLLKVWLLGGKADGNQVLQPGV